jgi:hypothetical protein
MEAKARRTAYRLGACIELKPMPAGSEFNCGRMSATIGEIRRKTDAPWSKDFGPLRASSQVQQGLDRTQPSTPATAHWPMEEIGIPSRVTTKRKRKGSRAALVVNKKRTMT